MKKYILPLFLTSTIVSATTEYTENINIIYDQNIVNEFMNHELKFNLANKRRGALASQSQYIYNGDYTLVNLPFAYNISRKIGVEINTPIISIGKSKYHEKAEIGLGDISLGVNYNFGKYSSQYGSNITTFRLKTTTAKEEKGLGTGLEAYTISHNFAKDIKNIRMYALLAYTINDDSIGDTLNLMVAGKRECFLSDKITTTAKLAYTTIKKPMKYDRLDLMVEFYSNKLIAQMPLTLGFRVPLIETTWKDNGSKTFSIYLNMDGFFN